MVWSVYGQYLETSDLSDTSVFQVFKVTNKNFVLRAVKTAFIFKDNPTFTNLNMKLYSYNGTAPASLIATSTNSPTKAELLTNNSGWAETYFDFNDIALKKDLDYALVVNGSGYTGTDASHIAWFKDTTDAVYQTGITLTPEKIGVNPFHVVILGANL